jgi:hypothetical protein
MKKHIVLLLVGLLVPSICFASDYDGGSALLTSMFSLVVGGVVGSVIQYAVTPKGVPKNHVELGRFWLGWAAFSMSVIGLSKFVWKQDIDSFLFWAFNLVIWGLVAFICGWVYGFFVKFTDSKPKNSAKLQPTTSSSISEKATHLEATATSKKVSFTPQTRATTDENSLYETVAKELDTGDVQKGLWTKLYSECGGDETQVKVKYIQERIASLKAKEADIQQQVDFGKAELDRKRLLNLIFPETFQFIKTLETYRKNNPKSTEVEASIEFIRMLGGDVTSKQEPFVDIEYTVEINTRQYKSHKSCRGSLELNEWFYKVLLPKVKLAEDFPLEKLRQMELYGITFDGNKYRFSEYSYINFDDAVRYAKFWADKGLTIPLRYLHQTSESKDGE